LAARPFGGIIAEMARRYHELQLANAPHESEIVLELLTVGNHWELG
jgi:hypothetical protein